MAKRNSRLKSLTLLAMAVLGTGLLSSIPANAQFFGSYYGGRPSRPPPSRGFFGGFPFFGGPGSGPFYRSPQPPPPSESFKAPAPKKYETPPASTVAVIGDGMADWLAYGLEEALSDTPEIGVVRYIRPTSGLVRYDAKNDQLEWGATIKDVLATEKPSAIVVMLGLNDRLPLRDRAPPKPAAAAGQGTQAQDKTQEKAQEKDGAPSSEAAKSKAEQSSAAATEPQRQGSGGSYEFHTDKWAELYSKRIDDMIAALRSRGVPVLWVGLPAVYGTRSTGDMNYLDELYRERAERAGIIYVDIWDGFVDENGRYVSSGPDFEGQTRRLRTSDGVHFTKAGAVKLAQYVAQALRRVMNNRLVPVALPAPDDTPKPGGNGQRPAVGPVVPLTAAVSNDSGGGLLGDNGRSSPGNTDPVATRVLVHGDPITPPSGRADDFAWPRPEPKGEAKGSAEIEAQPPAPAAAPAKGAAKPDAKKGEAGKNPPAKSAPNAPQAPAATRAAPHASLDGAPRPSRDVGGF